MSKTSSSHCWVLHSESLQYIENVHKCIHVWFFLLLQKFWNFLSLFKRSFLFVPHITPDIFLSLCFFNFQSLRRERDANGGCQAHVILPCFCPISHKGLVPGQEQGQEGLQSPFCTPDVNILGGYRRHDLYSLAMAHPFLTPSQGSWGWQDTWQGHCLCCWWSVCCFR